MLHMLDYVTHDYNVMNFPGVILHKLSHIHRPHFVVSSI
ncbi:hypothetical protein BDI4_540025 [Burkholderia diffusa]|nr:hypothetical protein BDI4_540025 [Burkholderia diffusa]